MIFEYVPYRFGSIVCRHYLYFDPAALVDIDTMRILIDCYFCSRQEFVVAFDESFVPCYFHKNASFCIACWLVHKLHFFFWFLLDMLKYGFGKNKVGFGFARFWVGLSIVNTGGCLFSREKAVKDVKSRVRFYFLVGVILNFHWSIFSWPIQIENNPD